MDKDITCCAKGHEEQRDNFLCHIDQVVCEVLGPYASDLEQETLNVVERNLPCLRCRVAAMRAENIPGVRLGKIERGILLAAPKPEDPIQIIEPSGNSRAEQEAHRRAIRKLMKAGLIWTYWKRADIPDKSVWWRGYREGWKTALRLSLLGEAILRYYRDEIEHSKPIRWIKHHEQIKADAREDKELLLKRFIDECKSEKDRAESWARISFTPESKGKSLKVALAYVKTLNVVSKEYVARETTSNVALSPADGCNAT